jgi:hypothetical protein
MGKHCTRGVKHPPPICRVLIPVRQLHGQRSPCSFFIKHADSCQDITVTCCLSPAAAVPANSRRYRSRHRRRDQAAAENLPTMTQHRLSTPLLPRPPQPLQLPLSPSPPLSPPAKRTHKARKRLCEAELLRDNERKTTLLLSPPFCMLPQSSLPSLPSPPILPTPVRANTPPSQQTTPVTEVMPKRDQPPADRRGGRIEQRLSGQFLFISSEALHFCNKISKTQRTI